ncbi:MAG: DUF4430 domain-containing protein [Candidatus Shapirobacteria bacterium]|nr:DUF4430 domain-containing protein [Candidatus Shapirobacteria bacterium]MDD3002684.1 DUF4430 domain-containing protein [Candidatus Shapirobacteria bacterium]MDD4382888.1 DUF4430 domain-containing protein [Candidatus Shapirobacteria bacterium]
MNQKILSLSLILFSTILLTGCSVKNSSVTSTSPTPTTISQSTNKIGYPCLKGETAFSSLTVSGNKMEFQQSSLGKIITSINGIPQGEGKYWQYSIDDKYAEVGADAYQCQGGEIITWELK